MTQKNYNWEIIANDFNSPFFRNYIWVRGLTRYPEINGIDPLVCGIMAREGFVEYIADMDMWKKDHEQLKAKATKDSSFFKNLIERSHQEGQAFNNWSERDIYLADLTKTSAKKLVELWNKFDIWQGNIYAIGTTIPVLDFQGFSYVEGFLKDYLSKHFSENDFKKYYSLFTKPTANSFAQDQEEDLLRLMKKYWHQKDWRIDVADKDIEELTKKYSGFIKDLERHTAKHSWVYYSYNGPEFTENNFLDFVKDYLRKNQDPDDILVAADFKKKDIEEQKKIFFSKFKPNSYEKDMLELAGIFVWGKPRRKDYQSKSYFHAKKLQLEVAKRLNLSLEQIRYAPFDMIKNCLLRNQEPDTRIINSIKKFHVIFPKPDGSVVFLHGKDAYDFDKKVKRPHKMTTGDTHEINGVVACPGKAKGEVKIVNDIPDIPKMAYGNILVSISTTPNIVTAMKKAAAIVTNEGGLTCHAAIVSRELNIPCIVGTKIATQVLKDGDRVEVDANRGIVKKVK